jgi:hypothetical protein
MKLLFCVSLLISFSIPAYATKKIKDRQPSSLADGKCLVMETSFDVANLPVHLKKKLKEKMSLLKKAKSLKSCSDGASSIYQNIGTKNSVLVTYSTYSYITGEAVFYILDGKVLGVN